MRDVNDTPYTQENDMKNVVSCYAASKAAVFRSSSLKLLLRATVFAVLLDLTPLSFFLRHAANPSLNSLIFSVLVSFDDGENRQCLIWLGTSPEPSISLSQ